MVNYQNGKIYKLVNDLNNTIYIGSTAVPRLSTRMTGHRKDGKDLTRTSGIYTAMRALGEEHFRIVLDHAFPCDSKDALEAEEYKTLDAFISAGTSVYNNIIGGKHANTTKAKMAAAQKGKKLTDVTKAKISVAHFGFGCLKLEMSKGVGKWRFLWYENGTLRNKSFSCQKFGDYGARWRAEQTRREVYPEWGSEEDCTCDDFGEIEWD